jgi:dTDP-4-dehydrorhamnose reductase
MPLKILQFGTTGQLATELIRQAPAHDVALTALSRAECDLADPGVAARKVSELRPDLVVIAAAHTAVDKAESEPDLARAINAMAPGAIAVAAAQVGAAVVNVSTDYVFDGAGGAPYPENAPTRPVNVYGATKLEGEQAVAAACARSLNIRTSWVVSAHGKNFVKTMLRVAAAGNPLTVVDDQSGRPTSAADLAGFILHIAPRLAAAKAGDPVFGTVHFANAGEVTWRGFAQAILAEGLGEAAPEVAPTTTAAYGAPAPRPLRATMHTGKLQRVYGVTPRPWQAALKEIVAELKAQG